MNRRSVFVLLVLVGIIPAARIAGAQTFAVSGTVRNQTQEPVAGALVAIDSGTVIRGVRTSADGRFRIAGVSRGPHALQVVSLGYRPLDMDITVDSADVVVDLIIQRTQVQQDTIVVRARATGVYGRVLSGTDYGALRNVTVEILGSGQAGMTDSAGRYSIPNVRGGVPYVARFSHPDFDERILSIVVPRDSAYELSPILIPSPTIRSAKARARFGAALRDLDTRMRFKSSKDVLIPRTDLGTRPNANLLDAVKFSRSYMMTPAFGPSAAANACVFVDGRPAPGWSLEAFAAGEVEAVEIHARGTVAAGRLERLWPIGAACSNLEPRALMRDAVPMRSINSLHRGRAFDEGTATPFIVIWLRR